MSRSTTPSEQRRAAGSGSDTVRQVVVVVSLIVAIVGSAIGSGAFGGTPIAQAAGGALSASATLIAPAVPAFSIWSVIYVGLAGYTVWQLLPQQHSDPRERLIGYWMAASMFLNGAWILSVQAGLLAVSVVLIAALLVVLAVIFRLTVATRPRGWVEGLLLDGVAGLYLGWVCVATGANITSGLQKAGFRGWGIPAEFWSVVVVAVVGVVGILLAVAGRGRLAPAASIVWGLSWVAVARVTGAPQSTATAIAALFAVVLVIILTVGFRVTVGRRARMLESVA